MFDIGRIAIRCLVATTSVGIFALSIGCSTGEESSETVEEETVIQVETDEEISETEVQMWTDEDLEAMVLTLAGECYDDKTEDKELVCQVILNRVSNDGFPDTILEVVSAPNQFDGYWVQSREVSENDYLVAELVLSAWYENDCEPLSEYLYFEAGDNRENVFRSTF